MENKDLIVIDRNEIAQFIEEGGKLVLKASAEEHLIKLLELEEMVKKAIDDVKSRIVEGGMSIDPDFKGVVGGRIKAIYRYTDSPYDYDRTDVATASPFLKEIKYYKVDGEKIEKYIEEVGEVPAGISLKEREKKLVLSLKDNEEI